MVKDLNSNQILSENLAYDHFNPHDAVRIMTFYTALRLSAGKTEEQMKLPENALEGEKELKSEGRIISGVDPKDEPHIEELFRLAATVRADDACVLLAIKTAGSVQAFVKAMNEQAVRLSMKHSRFTYPIAMPDQTTNAEDMLALIRALREEFPEESLYFSEEEFAFNGKTLKNPLALINPDDKSLSPLSLTKCCTFAGRWTRAEDKELPERELIFIFADPEGKQRIASKSPSVITACQADFESIELYEAGEIVGKIPVFEGQQPSVDVAAASSMRITLPRKRLIESGTLGMTLQIDHPRELSAPISKGMPAGKLKIFIDGLLAAQYEVVTAADVNRQNFFERVIPNKRNKEKANE